jgi:hypothetical protein
MKARLKRYFLHLLIFSLGAVFMAVYLFDQKIVLINAAMVAAYSNTRFGQSTLRAIIHDSCYFGAQHVALTANLYLIETKRYGKRPEQAFQLDYDQWCWKEADRNLEYLQHGQAP